MIGRDVLYESYCFQPLSSNPNKLFLHLKAIRELIAEF